MGGRQAGRQAGTLHRRPGTGQIIAINSTIAKDQEEERVY